MQDRTHLLILRAMVMIHRYNLLILCFCFLVHSRFLHRPLMLDDDYLAILESNTHDGHNRLSDVSLSSDSDEANIQQLMNKYGIEKKMFKLNFHSFLHLPRYLREIT